MITRHHVEPSFFDGAEELRGALDARFDKPFDDPTQWSYYHAPQLSTYLRTPPRKVFPEPLFQRFVDRLSDWCMEHLGLLPIDDPTLHLMVNGCYLALHSDFHNGTYGYVFSLTRWDQRSFRGGETLLMKDGIPSYKKHFAHMTMLTELVPARFNQLLVFDDRVVHATPIIEGNMDPKEGRIAMVGHMRATGPKVKGALAGPDVRRIVAEKLPSLAERLKQWKEVQGVVAARLNVGPTGEVTSAVTLSNTLVVPVSGYAKSDAVTAAKAEIDQMLAALKFPAAADSSQVTVAILVPVPDLKPIEVTLPHSLPIDRALACVEPLFAGTKALGKGTAKFDLAGERDEHGWVVRAPLDGVIRVGAGDVRASFEAPMWVPSQRMQLEVDVKAFLERAVKQTDG